MMLEIPTNLLPPERRRAFDRGYWIRLTVVAIVLITILTLFAAVLLAPTYVYLRSNGDAKKAQLVNLESKLSSSDESVLLTRLNTLSLNATTLIALSKRSSVSDIMRSVLAVSRPGITLFGFSYTPVQGKIAATFTISGLSATREALRAYQLALEEIPTVRSASLPVSAYASDVDIAFTITATLIP